MGTPFNEIYDLALVFISDRKIDKLYQTDRNTFDTYMQGLMMVSLPIFSLGVPKFKGGKSYLSYDLNTKTFNNSLDDVEKNAIARCIERAWFISETDVDIFIEQKLQGRDSKNHAESSNLKEKSNYIDKLREEISQIVSDYQSSEMDNIFDGLYE